MKNLPSWLGIGCVKCGTSWTWREIRKHPQIFTPQKKELFFFSGRGTLEDYTSHFHDATGIAGEWTPDYFHEPEAMYRIKKLIPKAKLITIFRHPVERAFSNWKHAIDAKRLRANIPFGSAFPHWRIRARGIYSRKLKEWYEIFPQEQIKILWYDDILKKPLAVLKDVFQFIGVDDDFIPNNYEKQFKFSYHNNEDLQSPMSDEDRQRWLEYYLPFTEELEEMTGRDLSEWKK